MNAPIRVMIVEDSQVVREFLEFLIGRDPRLTVVASVASAEQALEKLHEVRPDVISLDIRLPGMNGLEATGRIMAERPTPIVVCSASVNDEDLNISMNALRAGALAVVEKPVGTNHQDYQLLAERLCTQLVLMSKVMVVRQRLGRGLKFAATPPDAGPAMQPAAVQRGGAVRPRFQALGIVASTGGPNALSQILGSLDKQFPLPILLVQHITASFLEGFVHWLNSICPLSVTVARAGEVPQRGHIYVAPVERHLALSPTGIQLIDAEPVSSQRPSGTVLFRSMARSLGPAALAALLTGMGDDGAIGLKEIRDAGGHTIAEHESTAVVYGMPGVAVRLGAACEVLPLDEIAARIRELVKSGP